MIQNPALSRVLFVLTADALGSLIPNQNNHSQIIDEIKWGGFGMQEELHPTVPIGR